MIEVPIWLAVLVALVAFAGGFAVRAVVTAQRVVDRIFDEELHPPTVPAASARARKWVRR